VTGRYPKLRLPTLPLPVTAFALFPGDRVGDLTEPTGPDLPDEPGDPVEFHHGCLPQFVGICWAPLLTPHTFTFPQVWVSRHSFPTVPVWVRLPLPVARFPRYWWNAGHLPRYIDHYIVHSHSIDIIPFHYCSHSTN